MQNPTLPQSPGELQNYIRAQVRQVIEEETAAD